MLFLPLELTPVVGKPRVPPANLLLIVANFLLFFLSVFLGGGWSVGRSTGWYTVLLYGFSHVSLWHLVFNMWALWVFGNPVNRRLGDGYYLLAYLGTVVAIGLIGWLFYSGVVMGASGGVFAVMTVAMILMPGARLLLAYVICFPITVLVGLISPPKQYWLYWFIRAGSLTLS
jgi:membrane associated rhomboid family serine protease